MRPTEIFTAFHLQAGVSSEFPLDIPGQTTVVIAWKGLKPPRVFRDEIDYVYVPTLDYAEESVTAEEALNRLWEKLDRAALAVLETAGRLHPTVTAKSEEELRTAMRNSFSEEARVEIVQVTCGYVAVDLRKKESLVMPFRSEAEGFDIVPSNPSMKPYAWGDYGFAVLDVTAVRYGQVD